MSSPRCDQNGARRLFWLQPRAQLVADSAHAASRPPLITVAVIVVVAADSNRHDHDRHPHTAAAAAMMRPKMEMKKDAILVLTIESVVIGVVLGFIIRPFGPR